MAIPSTTFNTASPPDPLQEVDDIISSASEVNSLGTLVEQAYSEARAWRSSCGVDKELDYCLAAYENRYTAADRAALEITEENDIFAPITSTKCMALMSWLHDIFSNAEDKPWTLEPTPNPDLPDDLQLLIQAKLVEEFQAATAQGLDIDTQMLAERTQELRSLAMSEAVKRARRAVDRHSALIHDQLEEGGWRIAFDEFIKDLSIYPNAFVRGPSLQIIQKLGWDGTRIIPMSREALTVERLSPHDVFPSPDSTTPHDGTYIIERMTIPADTLYALAEHDKAEQMGLVPGNIRAMLARNPSGYKYTYDDEQDIPMTKTDEAREYEVIVYYGKVREEVLRDFYKGDVRTYSSEAAKDVEELEVWVCNGFVLRIVELGHEDNRPISTTSFLSVPGSFWGRSLPMVLRHIQRGANACLRSLVVNMAFSSGPIGEYDVDRLENEDEVSAIQPGRLYAIVNDLRMNQVAAQPAIRFHKIDSHARDLLGVYDRFEKMADDASGIPAYVIGAPQVAGAGRTLGGLAMLMGNAAKGVKRVVSNIDKHVIEAIVRRAFNINMQTHPDESIKADAQVVARGASGLLQRELQQARAIEVLQLLTPYVQAGLVPQDTIAILLRDIVRSLGYRADDLLPDPQRQEEILSYVQRLAAQNITGGMPQPPQPQQAPNPLGQIAGYGLGGAPPQPELDMRSTPPPNPADAENLPPA